MDSIGTTARRRQGLCREIAGNHLGLEQEGSDMLKKLLAGYFVGNEEMDIKEARKIHIVAFATFVINQIEDLKSEVARLKQELDEANRELIGPRHY